MLTSFEKSRVNKAPFIFDIKTSWINSHGDILSEALEKFIRNLTINEDVYFLSISSIIDWIEHPIDVENSGKQWLWSCDSVTYPYAEECPQNSFRIEEIKRQLEAESTNKKDEEKDKKKVLYSESLFVSKSVLILFTIFSFKAFFYFIIIDKDFI